jgi:hypothetical protein
VITAWEAITVAAVASSTIGNRAHSGGSRKKGASTTVLLPNSSAAWPK